MPLPNTKKKMRSIAPSTAVRKSRVSNRVTIGGDKTKANEEDPITSPVRASSAASQKLIVESDSDSDEKHSEAQAATDVTIYNEYNMGPAFGCKFPIPFIRFMVERALHAQFKGKTYLAADATKWVRELADTVNLKMKGYCLQHRYKHVISAVIYQQTGAGFFSGFRAVWDDLADDYVRVSYDGGTFVCVVSVFGCYQY